MLTDKNNLWKKELDHVVLVYRTLHFKTICLSFNVNKGQLTKPKGGKCTKITKTK